MEYNKLQIPFYIVIAINTTSKILLHQFMHRGMSNLQRLIHIYSKINSFVDLTKNFECYDTVMVFQSVHTHSFSRTVTNYFCIITI